MDRALVLLTRMPWPLDDGGRIDFYQSVWSLTRRFECTLLIMEPPDQVAGPVPRAISDLGVEVVRIPHTPPPILMALLRGALGRWPYTLTRYRNPAMDRTLRRLVSDHRPALAYLANLHVATYLDALKGVPVILRDQNVESLWMRRYASSLRNPLTRAYAMFQAARLASAEADLCARMDLVLAISEEEASILRRMAPSTRVEVVPIGIDPYRFLPRAPTREPTVLLLGSFAWQPNVTGALRFLEEGMGELRRLGPQARLRIVGKSPPQTLRDAARRAGADLVGYVDSVERELATATVMVVPLWVGAGARIKIVEALLSGLPTISTALGAEGLGLEDGRHYVRADSPLELAAAAAALISDPDRAAALADAGRRFALERFSLDSVARRTCELCVEALAVRAEGAARSA